MGGIKEWINPKGNFSFAQSSQVGRRETLLGVAADATLKVDGTWVAGGYCFAGLPPHRGTNKILKAATRCTWTAQPNGFTSKTCFSFTAGSGCRLAYFYQEDLGDYGSRGPVKAMPEKRARLFSPKVFRMKLRRDSLNETPHLTLSLFPKGEEFATSSPRTFAELLRVI